MITITKGSLLVSLDRHICHQCNCRTTYSAGLAAAIFEKYPWANVYSSRPHRGDDTSLFGSYSLHKNPAHGQSVINIYGQIDGGRPRSKSDSAQVRLQAFNRALKQIISDQIASRLDLQSIGFPCGIGCGLAGGNWDHYLKLLKDFADDIATQGVSVTLYCINNRPHRH